MQENIVGVLREQFCEDGFLFNYALVRAGSSTSSRFRDFSVSGLGSQTEALDGVAARAIRMIIAGRNFCGDMGSGSNPDGVVYS